MMKSNKKKPASATANDKDADQQHQQQMNKSTEHTVFVRFVPPSSLLRRHHIEDHFSQIGPIKKASLIIPKNTSNDNDNDEEDTGKTSKASSYGFIKYTCESDATDAAKQLNRSTLDLPLGDQQDGQPKSFQVMVELASVQMKKQQQQKDSKITKETEPAETAEQSTASPKNQTTEQQKKHNRVILRNLSFYAKENHIKDVLQQQFGTVVEVHIPTVKGKSRGFAFCTFASTKDAQKAIQTKQLDIKQRQCTIEWSVSKRVHQQQQEDQRKQQRKEEYQKQVKEKQLQEQTEQGGDNTEDLDDEESDSDDASSADQDDSEQSDNDSEQPEQDSDSEDDDQDDDDQMSLEDEDDGAEDDKGKKDDNLQRAVQEQRQLFVRNLPFDATRHDVFETFRTFGTLEAIYLVTDPITKLPRGTAFVTYKKAAGAARALRKAGTNNNSSRNTSNPEAAVPTPNAGISLKGRALLIDYAVDKETANTLAQDNSRAMEKHARKDKRNLYLKGEGRVDDEEEWQAMSESDRFKRQRAWHDKITKLKSPLFFMNAHRLSIRNISKSVDEAAIKRLLFQATLRGLERKLVTVDDLVAEWSASGELTPRQILERRKQYQRKDKHAHSGIEPLPDEENVLKPASLDERNTKRTIPSVFLDRDFEVAGGTKNAKMAPSRGFAFAEFTHHIHALACLRELNNNTAYSDEYAAGGKAAAGAAALQKRNKKKKTKKASAEQADEEAEAVKLPRIIVEFTVENRAKARQQTERRAQQQANRQKQKLEHKEKQATEETKTSPKKPGRGAKQREKKRQRKLEGDDSSSSRVKAEQVKQQREGEATAKKRKIEEQQQEEKPKGIKPPKKLKKGKRNELEAEEKFSKLVEKFEAARDTVTGGKDKPSASSSNARKEAMAAGKRWFD